MKVVAEALDRFIDAGFMERLHNPTHAARMYLLVVHGPEGKGLDRLLELLPLDKDGMKSLHS